MCGCLSVGDGMCDDVNSRLGYYVKLIIYFFCCSDFQRIFFSVGWVFDASYLQLKKWRCAAWTVSNFDFLGRVTTVDSIFILRRLAVPSTASYDDFSLILLLWMMMNEMCLLTWFNVDSCRRDSTIDSLDMRDAFDWWLLSALCLTRILLHRHFFFASFGCLQEKREEAMKFTLRQSIANSEFIF